jgi:hypothetical protein
MDLARSFTAVVRLARSAREPVAGIAALLRHLAKAHELESAMADVDVVSDIASVRSQLESLVAAEPPPTGLVAVYFGLFDAVKEEGTECIGYYVAGTDAYDADSGSIAISDESSWWPNGRYLVSDTLDAIKRAELAAKEAGRHKAHEAIAYSGQLGAAMLVSRFASTGLFPGRRRLVGFDSGDIAPLDVRSLMLRTTALTR